MRSMLAAAVPYTLAGYETLLDFSIPPWYLKGVTKIIHGRAIVHYTILRPSEAACAQRAAERKEGPIAIYDHEFYESFSALPHHIISNDTVSAQAVAEQIYLALRNGSFVLKL
jgi:hypothetical protein